MPTYLTRDKDRNLFILGQVLSIKLREVMREDMGGVYGVRAGGQIERSPHQGRSFSISFGCILYGMPAMPVMSSFAPAATCCFASRYMPSRNFSMSA